MIASARKPLVIELGSNSCKVFLPNIADYRIPLRLADGILPSGELSEDGMGSILKTLTVIQKRFGTEPKYIVVGTEALRRAKNQAVIVRRIEQETGLKLRVLSAREEAEATFWGVMAGSEPIDPTACFDIGGSSVEIITAIDNRIERIQSFALGAVDLTRKFDLKTPITDLSHRRCEDYISRELRIEPKAGFRLVGTGGAVMTCAMVALKTDDMDGDLLDGYELPKAELVRQKKLYRSLSPGRIAAIPGMDRHRADIILPAVMLMVQLMDRFEVQHIHTSLRGLRHGIVGSGILSSSH